MSASVASCDVSSKDSASYTIKWTDDCKYFDGDHSDEHDEKQNDEEDNDGDLKLMACLSRIKLCLPLTALERGEGD